MLEAESNTLEDSGNAEAADGGSAFVEKAEREPLHAGFACLWCGYDLSGSASWRCPECGKELSEADFATVKRRRSAERSAVGRSVLWGLLLGGVFVVTFGIVLFSRLGYWGWAPVWLLGSLSLPGTFAAGVVASMLGRAGTRKHHLLVWSSLQSRLQAPWLLAVLGSLLLAPVAWIVRVVSVDIVTRGFRGLMYFAFVIGVISAIASAWSWKRALVERAHEIDLPAGAARGCMKAAGWGMFVGALVVGGCVGLLGYAALISLADARSI